VNVEYLINQNKYAEAINLAKKYLKADDSSTELKVLYNKAVSLVNNKHKLLEGGDNAYYDKDYKSAEIFYRNVLPYCDENEKNVINTKLEILNQKIPQERRSAVLKKSLVTFLVCLIIGVCGFALYYFYYLEEDRTFADIEKGETFSDARAMELQIERYEKFGQKFRDGHLYEKSLDKVNLLSYALATRYLNDDWRSAFKYYSKITQVKDSKSVQDLYDGIYTNAEVELKNKLTNSKRLNSSGKFIEAKDELDDALTLIDVFPGEIFIKEFNIVKDNIGILNKKISTLIKVKNIDKEINETLEKLKYSGAGSKSQIDVFGIVNELIKADVYTVKTINPEKMIAVKVLNKKKYKIGELVNFSCVENGYVSVGESPDEFSLPYYEQVEGVIDSNDNYALADKETISQRLRYLKQQKEKADSVLNLKLKL